LRATLVPSKTFESIRCRGAVHDEDGKLSMPGLRVIVDGEPDIVSICHCHFCQRRTGVALSCNAYFPKSNIRLEGEHKIYTREAAERRKMHTYFCPTCGSTVGWILDLRPNQFGVAVGCFTTPTSRLQSNQSGRRTCALFGRRCQPTFCASRAVDTIRSGAETAAAGPLTKPRPIATTAGAFQCSGQRDCVGERQCASRVHPTG
jgi:hypothetical protein